MSRVPPFAQSAKTSPQKASSDSEDKEIWETWISKDHKELAELFKEMDYGNALTKIAEMESRTAPNPGATRLSGSEWENTGLMCLASADTRVLQAVVDLTLPQRVANGELDKEVRRPALGSPLWQGKPDPIIYIQFMAGRDGRGLTCAETLKWIDALKIMAGLKPDDASHDRPGQTLSAGVNLAYWSRRNTHGHKSFLQSVDKQYKPMQTVVSDVAKVYREIVAEAEADGLDHIMIRPEVGWAWQGYDRCRAHYTLDESFPPAFRLAQCVLVHLFPTKGFQLYQFVLFDVVGSEGAAVGESVGHQVGASYSRAYGGWNIEQAGIPVAKSGKATTNEWSEFRSSTNGLQYLDTIGENLAKVEALYQGQVAAAKEHIRLRELEEEVIAEKAKAEATEASLKVATQKHELRVEQLRVKTATLRAEVQRRKDREEDKRIVRDAVSEFLDDIKDLS